MYKQFIQWVMECKDEAEAKKWAQMMRDQFGCLAARVSGDGIRKPFIAQSFFAHSGEDMHNLPEGMTVVLADSEWIGPMDQFQPSEQKPPVLDSNGAYMLQYKRGNADYSRLTPEWGRVETFADAASAIYAHSLVKQGKYHSYDPSLTYRVIEIKVLCSDEKWRA